MRCFVVLGVFALLASHPLSAQEHFEIAVYSYATAHRGEWELEGHINYASRGTSGFAGTVAPTQGQCRFAPQLTRGVRELGEGPGSVLGPQGPGWGSADARGRRRLRIRGPEP